MKPEYHLNCANCDNTYWSKEGFPKPQLCTNCMKVYQDGMKAQAEKDVEICDCFMKNLEDIIFQSACIKIKHKIKSILKDQS